MGHRQRGFAGVVLAACIAVGAMAQQQATPMLQPTAPRIHEWQAPPPRMEASAYFTNLQDGASIETPFLLKFGLSGGWGLAPIAAPVGGKSGHHHLLVNRELPLDFKKPLPFDTQYIHFGKGQMETVFNAPPGKYTLRLLLADHQHLPHFVYSQPLAVTVTRQNTVDPQSLVRKGIALVVDSQPPKAPFLVRFHASGLNVGHGVQKDKDTGHFRLTMTPTKGAAATLDFVNGQTEVWLAPPAGEYRLALDLVDNQRSSSTLGTTASASIAVH